MFRVIAKAFETRQKSGSGELNPAHFACREYRTGLCTEAEGAWRDRRGLSRPVFGRRDGPVREASSRGWPWAQIAARQPYIEKRRFRPVINLGKER